MQPSDDVQFRDAERERLTRLLHHLLDAQLEAVLVALLAGEGAELAGEDAVVRVVEVAVEDVAGAVAHLPLPREVRDGPDGVDVLALEKPQGVGIGKALPGDDLVVEVTQSAVLNGKTHSPG